MRRAALRPTLRASLGAVLVLALLTAGCGEREPSPGAPRDAGGIVPPDAVLEEGDLVLRLEVTPLRGDAPLTVALRAVLEGDLEDPIPYRCATAAFTMDDDTVQLVAPDQPCTGEAVQRVYETTYTYESAGRYAPFVRLIARPVTPSRRAQVLVLGSTPTPVPQAAVPGPTIVIASPRPPVRASATPAAPASPTAVALAEGPRTTPTAAGAAARATARPASREPTEAPPRGRASPPRPAAPTEADARDEPDDERLAASVLPADLYFLDLAGDGGARLLRLPAAGDAPITLGEADAEVDDYQVSTLGLAAVLEDGRLELVTPAGTSSRIVEADAEAPVWTPDGRRLAYARDGRLALFDVLAFEEGALAGEGRPVAFSRDGRRLLARAEDTWWVVDTEADEARRLPVPAARHAGWLPDRDVLWFSGPGLRFVTTDDAWTVTELLGEDVDTSRPFLRPDRRVLLLVEGQGGARLHVVDLTADLPRAEAEGARLPLPVDADFAWSPDGRTLAVAGPAGVTLLDPLSGAGVPLVDGMTRAPTWVLAAGGGGQRDAP